MKCWRADWLEAGSGQHMQHAACACSHARRRPQWRKHITNMSIAYNFADRSSQFESQVESERSWYDSFDWMTHSIIRFSGRLRYQQSQFRYSDLDYPFHNLWTAASDQSSSVENFLVDRNGMIIIMFPVQLNWKWLFDGQTHFIHVLTIGIWANRTNNKSSLITLQPDDKWMPSFITKNHYNQSNSQTISTLCRRSRRSDRIPTNHRMLRTPHYKRKNLPIHWQTQSALFFAVAPFFFFFFIFSKEWLPSGYIGPSMSGTDSTADTHRNFVWINAMHERRPDHLARARYARNRGQILFH